MDLARQFSSALASDLALASDPAALAADADGGADSTPPTPPRPSPQPPSTRAATTSTRQFAAYVTGVTACILAAFELGAHPATFVRFFYSGAAAVLLPLRFFVYRRKGWHLFMVDL